VSGGIICDAILGARAAQSPQPPTCVLIRLSPRADQSYPVVDSIPRHIVQVGNGGADHSVWTRPEDITNPYPVYLITPSKPGSDLAGAMAAALAATSVVFKTTDPTYAASCLSHARSIYTCAALPTPPACTS
jgi:hypothetical protein